LPGDRVNGAIASRALPALDDPWVQILEYLGRVPDGTTGEFLKPDGNRH
jgi:hypothetical protein